MGNVYSQTVVVLKILRKQLNFKSAVIRSKRSSCFFSFSCHQTQTSADDVFINQLSSPDDVITGHFSALFVISPPQEGFVKLAN